MPSPTQRAIQNLIGAGERPEYFVYKNRGVVG